MSATRIGINGFGRMGPLALRAAWGWPEVTFAHINEIKGDASTAAHLLTFDSVHGRWAHDARGADDALVIDGQSVGYSAVEDPGGAPWQERGVGVVPNARAGSGRARRSTRTLPTA